MKTIKILGSGCPNCKITETIVREVISELNIEATVVKVEDIMEIMKYNILTTPVLLIDEQIKIKGRIPSKNEVMDLLK